MNTQEMKERYTALYDYMAASREPRNMKLFGSVMTEMMDAMLAKMPAEAGEMIDKLEAIRWKQFLTPKEAEGIVAGMVPKAPWTRDAWASAMESLGLPPEEQPDYNRCALWTEMNKMYSDFGETVAGLLGRTPDPGDGDIIAAAYKMALNTLKDRDGVYDIRRYFRLM